MQNLFFMVQIMQLKEMITKLKECGYTQEKIATFAKTNQSTISRILNGRSTSYETAEKIKEFYFLNVGKKQKTPSGN